MSGNHRIAFVINPNSGTDRKTNRVKLIRDSISKDINASVFIWDQIEKRDQIFSEILEGNYDIAVAVGGDGTVSQMAAALCGTNTALGIIPFGSGNGLARHLKIPMDKKKAVTLLENAQIVAMDYGKMNGQKFFCTAGIGFDARIGHLFAQSGTRGLKTYASIVVKEFKNYKPETYLIKTAEGTFSEEAFLITIANAGQYGNNAWIAPMASVTDGRFHVTVLKKFGWLNAVKIAIQLFRKNINQSDFVKTFETKDFSIVRMEGGPVHFDGEPAEMGKILEFKIHEKGLKVAVPPGVKI
ncbi:MAG: YegS/Rv2252/BmrU family lipid kinase [Bacteroidia bacterium]